MASYVDEKTGYQPLAGADHIDSDDDDRRQATTGRKLALLQRAPRQSSQKRSSASLTLGIVGLVALTMLLGVHMLAGRLHGRGCGGQHNHGSHANLTVEERVDRILTSTPLIDGHNDFPIFIREAFNNHIYNETFRNGFERDGLPMHVDLPRLRAGKNGGAFWSVFTPCPHNGKYANSVHDTLLQIDLVARLKTAYPDVFSPNVDSATALAAFERGQLISPLGIEGLHQIGNSVANLRLYHALGVRYATLTHNCPNIYADAALWERPFRKAHKIWGGLSPRGRQAVHEMNRIGLIVDLSHTSVDTMEDVLGGRPDDAQHWNGSLAPVIFSHSSAHSVCPHPRNVPDHVLQLVKQRRGVVMVNFSPDFVSCHWTGSPEEANGVPTYFPGNATLEHVATHVLHIGRLIGFDHVGLGSDFDGIADTPRGLGDVAAFPALVAELLRRGVTDEEAAKIVGGNVLRVWREVDAVAAKLQAAGVPPLEDDPARL
ncbi:hypothetical protein SCUCBS95973_005056 [Sporothrix curviconia]|uniref:Dipeptidase n=1 Tax=Sporothrix curviconia TaxID=1260050 RepID=A0ABP0BUK2_9PEZI